MTKVPLEVGNSCSFTKTVSESDVYQFGGITGDYSQMHFNEAFMKTTKYGTRIVHGVLTFAFGSTASTLIQQKYESPIPSASYGYDHLRFTAPVYFGDTLTATYTVKGGGRGCHENVRRCGCYQPGRYGGVRSDAYLEVLRGGRRITWRLRALNM